MSIRQANLPLVLDALVPVGSYLCIGIALGLGIGASVSCKNAWLSAGVLTLFPFVRSLFKKSPKINRGRMTAKFKGDFCVFLIGIRPNNRMVFTRNFLDAGKAMSAIEQELADNPELGCLGSESFAGANTNGSTTLLVQYWKSPEHLERYAQSASNKHYSPWLNLMKLGKKKPELGFWHETFIVKDGNYECIYVNCPLFGFANARGVTIEPAARDLETMKSRLKKSAVDSWPKGFSEHSNY